MFYLLTLKSTDKNTILTHRNSLAFFKTRRACEEGFGVVQVLKTSQIQPHTPFDDVNVFNILSYALIDGVSCIMISGYYNRMQDNNVSTCLLLT